MAEEVANSSRVVPRSMLLALMINGATGFAILIAFLFTAGDLLKIVESSASYPFMYMLASSTGSKGAAVVLSSMMAILQACAGLAGISSGSRMLWSFSREQAIPGWRWVRQVCDGPNLHLPPGCSCWEDSNCDRSYLQVNQRTLVPFHSTLVVVVAAGLLSLINIGSAVVLNIILSLVLEAFFASYMISLTLLLYRRLRGDLTEPGQGGGVLNWGPFRVKGWLGTANNIFAIAYSIIMMFFGCWPPENHPAPKNINYSIVIFAGVTLISIIYYVGWARKHYQGPLAEL